MRPSLAGRGVTRLLALGLLLLLALALAALARADVVQKGDIRVSFSGSLRPKRLPRFAPAPVAVSFATKITPIGAGVPRPLTALAIEINRHGRLERRGLPVCRLEQIQPANNAEALSECRRSLVGTGSFSSRVRFEGQAPFPKQGKIYAFNGVAEGRPAILAHIYGTVPGPSSYTIVFEIGKTRGTYGTTLRAVLPDAASQSSYVTGLSLELERSFSYRGKRRSFLSASCPAPSGVAEASFSLARASYSFLGGRRIRSTLSDSCRPKGR